MNPPAESSELELRLDLMVVGGSEKRREAILKSIQLAISEHIEETLNMWETRSNPDIKISYLLD
jgi:hypothetical protein